MEGLVKNFADKCLKNKEKIKYFKSKDLFKGNKFRFFSKSSLWFVRYVADFIIGFRCQSMAHLLLLEKLNEFLGERGLKLSEEKTFIKKQKIGHKFDFLGWRFHSIHSTKVNWMTRALRSSRERPSNRKELYVYPSPKSTKSFRKAVKFLTNFSKVNNSIYKIILDLRAFITGWDNYFTGGKIQVLKRKLNWYVIKRCRMFLFKKYKGKYGGKIQTFLKKDGKWGTLSVMVGNTSHSIPVMWKSKNIPFLFLENSNELKNNSFIINPIHYLKKSLLIGKLKGEKHAALYYKQKGICPICSEDLINEFTHDANIQIHKSDFPLDMSYLSLIHNKINICHEPRGYHLNYDKWDTLRGERWCKGLEIDYIIPKELFNQIKNVRRILRSNINLRLVHFNCHNSKINHDKKMYIILKKSIRSEISYMGNLLDPHKRLKSYVKCPFSKIVLDKISNNVNYEILKFSLLSLIETFAMDEVYNLQYIKNKAGNIKCEQNKEINILRRKLIDMIRNSKDKTDTNDPIRKKFTSHRLAALKCIGDKRSVKTR